MGPGTTAAQDRLDPGHHLPWAERFGDVVVRAQFQPDDPVRLVPLRGQHDDRRPADRFVRPDRAQHFQPVGFRKQDVEEDQVRLLLPRLENRRFPVRCEERREPLLAQVVRQQILDLFFVFDDKDRARQGGLRGFRFVSHYMGFYGNGTSAGGREEGHDTLWHRITRRTAGCTGPRCRTSSRGRRNPSSRTAGRTPGGRTPSRPSGDTPGTEGGRERKADVSSTRALRGNGGMSNPRRG